MALTWIEVVGMALAGGAGAATRLCVDAAIRARVPGPLPVGTMAINVTGSLLLGVIAGLALRDVALAPWQVIAGTGFCGGFTTFSTASFESVRLLQQRRRLAATANAIGTLVPALLAAAAGLALTAARL